MECYVGYGLNIVQKIGCVETMILVYIAVWYQCPFIVLSVKKSASEIRRTFKIGWHLTEFQTTYCMEKQTYYFVIYIAEKGLDSTSNLSYITCNWGKKSGIKGGGVSELHG